MRIGELARTTGVPVRTIRFYEDTGLLPATARTSAGYRVFEDSHVHRLQFIRNAQGIGLKLEQIREILDAAYVHGSPCERVRTNVQESIRTMDQRIASLQAMRTHLLDTLDRLDRVPQDGESIEICPAIEAVPEKIDSSLDSPVDWRL